MEFRTVIELMRGRKAIDHSTAMVMLGSCFTTEVGARLARDGFNVSINPMGALYNPATIASAVEMALDRRKFTIADLDFHNGVYHCLDFHTQYSDNDPERLVERLNNDLNDLGDRLEKADLWIITFGTAFVFEYGDKGIVGNCHKLPGNLFTRRRMAIEEITVRWQPLVKNRRVIFTVSPIRHLADGLHGNRLSKATLLLAVDSLNGAEYFPAYEIMNDDLRDYRFYAADMKHPSETAVDYIYEKFSETYFDAGTIDRAKECRKEWLRSAHRPILRPDNTTISK